MVNRNPSEVDDEVVPETTEPVERDTHENMLVGVYRTEEEGAWKMEIHDWANRVIEATVYETDRDGSETRNGVSFVPLETPEDMEDEAYLVELLNRRVDELESEAQPA